MNIVIKILDYIAETFGFDVRNPSKIWIIIIAIIAFYFLREIYYFYTDKGVENKAEGCLNSQNKMIWEIYQKPLSMQNSEILERTLKEFYIASSHNTYIPCDQNGSIASYKSLKRAVLLGARVIELDVFSERGTNEPIIAHGVERDTVNDDIYTTTKLKFIDACNEINKYAFMKTDDPLFLTLELNTHKLDITNNKMAQYLKDIFGDRILAKDPTKSIGDYQMKELIGKVVILSGGGATGDLKDIINNTWGDDKMSNKSSGDAVTKEMKHFNETGITRVYPAGNLMGHLSYNFDPQKFWDAGCQIVALNYQTNDNGMKLNNEKFKESSFVLR